MSPDKLPQETFSTVDAAWLHMDKPTNLAMITGVMSFPEPLDFARLQATVEARLLPFVRFRQRVQETNLPFGLPRWELDADFDLANHVQHVTLPEPGDHAALQNQVSELMSIPLDRSRPLWQMHYIDNYEGGSALVSRLHHCIADGIALMQVLLSLTDDTPDAPWPEPYEEPKRELSRLAHILLPAVKTAKAINHTWQSAENMAHEVAAFKQLLPQSNTLHQWLGLIDKTALKQRLVLNHGDYKLTQTKQGELSRYEIVLPVAGQYTQIRQFIANVLQLQPALALSNVKIQRDSVLSPTVEAKLVFVLFLQGGSL